MQLGPSSFLGYCLTCIRPVITSINRFIYTSGGPGAVVEAACLESFKETKCFFPAQISHIMNNLRDREVACSTSDHHSSNFEFCVRKAVSSHSSHHPQEVLLVQFSLYVHKGGLKPYLFHFISTLANIHLVFTLKITT